MDNIAWIIVGVIFIFCIIGNIIGGYFLVKNNWDSIWKKYFSSKEEM